MGFSSIGLQSKCWLRRPGSLQAYSGMAAATPVLGVLSAEFSSGLDRALCLFSSNKTFENQTVEHRGAGTRGGS